MGCWESKVSTSRIGRTFWNRISRRLQRDLPWVINIQCTTNCNLYIYHISSKSTMSMILSTRLSH